MYFFGMLHFITEICPFYNILGRYFINGFEIFLDVFNDSSDIISRSPRALRRRAQGCLSGWPLLYIGVV